MDDSCAVCADALEWVGYGPCGHREVCATCVVRLRFVMDDKHCCICKTLCPAVFVTKAMGDYTRVINDFSVFPIGANEGKVGEFWYHEDTQAFFDDVDQYRMIRAMCRLSCSVCDNAEDQVGQTAQARRRSNFRSIGQLRGHLAHQHKLNMCSLCLEGRKVFICEQKLYTKAQLDQHNKSGDSEVDGTEVERSGFAGHPMCGFCTKRFYGDNEIYTHMSREHFTCHICQRQHPGQYDYFRNYDDLEIHFRKDHFLCEDEACLSKKFIVFMSEQELKRHNAMEHGGRMSRAQRNAALQIPTSFIYRRNEEDSRRGRGRGRSALHDRSDRDISSMHNDRDNGLASRIDSVMEPLRSVSVSSSSGRGTGQSSSNGRVFEELSFPPLQDDDIPDVRMNPVPDETTFPSLSEPQSRYAHVLSQSPMGSAKLGDESLFPPLPGLSNNRSSAPTQQGLQSLAKNTLASRLQQRSKGNVKVLHSARPRPSENPEIVPHVSSSTQMWPTPDQGLLQSGSSQLRNGINSLRENGIIPPAKSAWNPGVSNKMKHSVSTPNLVPGGSSSQTSSSTSYAGNKVQQQPQQSSQTLPADDVRAANKALVESMRVALGMDEDRFSAFKEIAAEYRQGAIGTSEYLSYVEQFGLSHLVPEMARLLPDPRKQKELADAYYTNIRFKSLQESSDGGAVSKEGNRKKKGKGKAAGVPETNAAKDVKDSLADSFLDTVRKLQSNNPQEGVAEVLSRDGYRSSKGKTQLLAGGSSSSTDVSLGPGPISKDSGAKDNVGKGGGSSSTTNNSKQSKKTSKFLRARLGDSSLATLDFSRPNVSPERPERESQGPQTALPVRGVWKHGGAQKLFSSNERK